MSAANSLSDERLDRGSGQEDGRRYDAEAPGEGGTPLDPGLLLGSHESREIPAARKESARNWRYVLDDVGDR